MPQSSSVLHQVLHGYRDGHRLLAGSISIPPGVQQTMLVLSDLSGHGKVNRFDEYITAYPLNEIGYYALAKTWYAREMPRPGCVWTHTLLVPFAMLASVRNMRSFTNFFVRPADGDFLSYSEPVLSLSFDEESDDRSSPTGISTAASLLFAIYGSPAAPVLVPVESPEAVENLFFEVWSQQWPRLRRSFTFCTGAIAGRRLGSRWFDLHAVPAKRLEEVHRSIDGAVKVKSDSESTIAPMPDWLDAASSDLVSSQDSDLRRFMFGLGAEAGGGRSAFSALVDMYLELVTSGPNVRARSKFMRSLESVFPSADQGAKFKEQLLSGTFWRGEFDSAIQRLGLLLLAKKETFAASKEDINLIVRGAWSEDAGELVDLLSATLQAKRQPNAAVFTAVASAMKPGQLAMFSERAMPLVLEIAKRQPILLVDPTFSGSEPRNEILVNYVAKKGTTKKDIRTVVSQWILEGNYVSIDQSVHANRSRVIPALLDLAGNSERIFDSLDEREWLSLIGIDFEVGLQWIGAQRKKILADKISTSAVALVVIVSPLNALPFDDEMAQIWAKLLTDDTEHQLLHKKTSLKLYQQAMQRTDDQAAWIASLAFPSIYRLPSRHQMSQSEWDELRKAVGDSDWYWDWDWCRSLREALIDKFVYLNWPINYFSEMIENDHEVGYSILDSYYYKSRHKKFLKRLTKKA